MDSNELVVVVTWSKGGGAAGAVDVETKKPLSLVSCCCCCCFSKFGSDWKSFSSPIAMFSCGPVSIRAVISLCIHEERQEDRQDKS
jgi:hypothetical protein